MRRLALILILAVSFSVGLVLPSAADDHIAGSMKRTYMGRTFPPQTSEVWIADGKSSVRDGVVTIITRNDLGKKWILNQRTKKYLEESISPQPAPPSKTEKFRIQEYGWDYEPVYEWSAKETGEIAEINGLKCIKVLLAGEADYASETREIWISKDVPIDLKRYYSQFVEPGLEPAIRGVYRSVSALRNGLAVKTITTQERPIGNPFVWENVLTKAEKSEPPAGIYELPGDYTKAKNRDEWAGR